MNGISDAPRAARGHQVRRDNHSEFRKFSAPVTHRAGTRFRLEQADPRDREEIYRLRHAIYAEELGQHPTNAAGRLADALDDFNVYLTAKVNGELAGFVSLTPPRAGRYSLDKYVAREQLPFAIDDHLFEVRLLSVREEFRGRPVAALLMYAAFRWVEARGGTRIAAIGRQEVLGMYRKCGLRTTGLIVQSGAVTYEVMHAEVSELRAGLGQRTGFWQKLETETDWRLNIPFHQPAACFHGGAFFNAVGPTFDRLERAAEIINADVLDAWFPPAPEVLAALQENLPWLLRTSPPTACEGMIQAIAQARGVEPSCVLPGAGSSDLIFRAFRHWLAPHSRVLLLDPTYGEYAHVLERVIGCHVERLTLSRADGYALSLEKLAARLTEDFDLVVLVNPNSPTGRFVPRGDLENVLAQTPAGTRVWVDETYIDYVGAEASLERFASRSENVIVCKSMSKVYALSGARAAYLCAGPHWLEALRAITPPWVVSLPAQVAAVRALASPDYYAARHRETHALRDSLAAELAGLDWEIIPGTANFLLGHLPEAGPTAAEVVRRAREHGLFLRDAAAMGTRLGRHALRVAVKDASTNRRIVEILRAVGS